MLLAWRRWPAGALLIGAAVLLAGATGCGTMPAGDGAGAEPERAGHGSLTTRLGYYFNDDGSGDGNPFLDEALTVIEPIVMLDYSINDQWAVNLKYQYDLVSSASIERLSKFPQQTGASGDFYSGVDAGLTYRPNDVWTIGGFGSFSQEYDYDSFGAGLNASRDFEDGNSVVSWSLTGFWDRLDVIRFDGDNAEGKDFRRSLTAAANWYQIFGPATHGTFGLTATWQQGFLEAPFNAVVIENSTLAPNSNLDNMARGLESFEELPGNRYRGALFGRVRHWLPTETAIEMGGRLYADSWGMQAITVEPLVRQSLIEDVLSAGLRYRFHSQTGVDYFGNHFTRARRYQTQDSDLGPFFSNGVGLLFTWHLSEAFTLDGNGDWTSRSDGIEFWSAGLTLTVKF